MENLKESQELKNSFEMSTEIKDIALALSLAQSEFEAATKSESNPFFKSKYADLASITEVYRKPLAKNKIAVLQPVSTNNGDVTVITMLVHSSGQYFKSTLSYKLQKQDIQAVGSAITYLRRYSIQSLLSIPATDDDGEAAVDRRPIQQAQKPVNGNGIKTMGDYAREVQALKNMNEIDLYEKQLSDVQRTKLQQIIMKRKEAVSIPTTSTIIQ